MATPTRPEADRGKRRAILLSVAAALAFWLSTRLSDRYTTTETIAITYVLPAGTAFARDPPRAIAASVTATGWELLRERVRRGGRELRIDSTDLRRYPDGVIQLAGKIREAYQGGDLRVEALSDPRIVLRTESVLTRRLPLRLRASVTYGPGYSAEGQPRLTVDSVSVRGPRSVVGELKEWPTDSLILRDLQDSARVSVGISGSGSGAVTVLPNSTEVFLRVQQYTERTLEVPVTVVGYAGRDSVSAYPQMVRVTSAIGLSDYARLNAEEYELIVDVTGVTGSAVLERPVVVRRAPTYAVSTTVSPRTVEVFVFRPVPTRQ